MKIAITCPASLPATPFGGILILAINLAKKFVEKNHEVTIYTTDLNFKDDKIVFDKKLKNEENLFGFKIKRTHVIFKILNFYINPKMYNQIKKDKPEIILSIGARAFQTYIGKKISEKYDIPFVISDNGGLTTHPDLKTMSILKKFLYKFQNLVIKSIFKQSVLVIAANEYEKNDFKNFVDSEKIRIIKNGIDEEIFKNSSENFKIKYNIDERIILFVGRFNLVKGLDLLLKAFAEICKEKKFFNIKLVIMGSNFGYYEEMIELINKLKIQSRVKIIQNPSREDVISAYNASEFLVNPSRWELSPLTPLEGFACKKTSISTDFAGIPYVIENKKTGILIKYESILELINAIKLLLEDEELRNRLGLEGFNLIKNELNSKKMAEHFLLEFKKIITKPK